jgi:hypothetical protein
MFSTGTSLLLAVALGCAGCSSGAPAGGGLDVEHARVLSWLRDEGAKVTAGPDRVATEWSRDIRWTIEVDKSWSSFLADLQGTKPIMFDRCDFGRRMVTCHESRPGDKVLVQLTLVTSGHPTRASVTLTGRAD